MMIVTMIMSYKEYEGDNSAVTKKVTMLLPEHQCRNCTGHQIGSTQNQPRGSVSDDEKYWASSLHNLSFYNFSALGPRMKILFKQNEQHQA